MCSLRGVSNAGKKKASVTVSVKLPSWSGGQCSGFQAFLYQSSFGKTVVSPMFTLSASLHNCFMNFCKRLKRCSRLQSNAYRDLAFSFPSKHGCTDRLKCSFSQEGAGFFATISLSAFGMVGSGKCLLTCPNCRIKSSTSQDIWSNLSRSHRTRKTYWEVRKLERP